MSATSDRRIAAIETLSIEAPNRCGVCGSEPIAPSRLPRIGTERRLAADYAAALAAGDRNRITALRRTIETIGPRSGAEQELRATLTRYLTPYSLDALPTLRGVYVIGSSTLFCCGTNDCYVGLSSNIHSRFQNGHLRGGRTRANDLLTTADAIYVAAVQQIDLVAAETLLFILLRQAGLSPRNAVGSLGQVGETKGSPVVSCRLSDGSLRLHKSSVAASRELNIRHAIPGVLAGYQNAAGGHTFRWATDAEVKAGAPDLTASDAVFTGRNFSWTRGGLTPELCASFGRAKRYTRRSTGHYGVTRSDRAPGFWTARVVAAGERSNNPGIVLGRRFASEKDAYAVREAYLDAHPELAPYNRRGRYGDSRAT